MSEELLIKLGNRTRVVKVGWRNAVVNGEIEWADIPEVISALQKLYEENHPCRGSANS